jgi:hypothetical protein
MFDGILKNLEDGIHNIDILISKRILRNKSFSIQCGPWKLDDNLKGGINNIKSYSESLSKTCIKLVLLINSKTTNDILNSIAVELQEVCTATIGSYLYVISILCFDALVY